MEYKLKVEPEKLILISSNVLGKVNKAQDKFYELNILISNMSRYWEGEGYDKMRNAYDIRKDDYERIFRAIKTHTMNLQTIAQGYLDTEHKNVETVELYLPEDIIE